MKVSLHKADVFFYVLTYFVLGIGIASIWHINDEIVRFTMMFAGVVMIISGYQKTFGASEDGIRKRKTGFLFGIILLVVALGIYRFNYVNQSTGLLEQLADIEIGREGERVGLAFRYAGYVASDPERIGDRQQFSFKVKLIDAGDRILKTDELILVTSGAFPERNYGQQLVVQTALKRPENYSNFDYITYLRRDGISFIASYPEIKEVKNEMPLSFFETLTIPIYRSIFDVKNSFESSIERSIPEPYAAYTKGILTGARANIPQDLKNDFATTSTSHILAISGYNIAVVGQAILFALMWFMRRKKAFWVSVALIISFVILTGASSSVVRAGVMGLLILFANGFGKLYYPRNALALAAFVMTVFNPFVLIFDIGFQLSFLAVIGILYGYPILSRKIKIGPKESYLKELILMTISAQLFVLPFLLYYFGQFSIVSLPANILVLPFVPFLMLFGFLSGLAGMIWIPLGKIFGWLAWAIGNYEINIIQYFARLPHASIAISIDLVVLVILYIILILIFKRLGYVEK